MAATTQLDPDAVDRIAGILADSKSALFITGAGISAESGLPTYRGVGGLYNDQGTEEGIPIEVALSGPMFNERPELTWKYIHQIESACQGATFNTAHEIIATLETRLDRVWVLTQNVDGFHRDAGSKNVIEIHGNIRDLICTRCDWHDTVTSYQGLDVPPMCSECNAVIRPDVVLFGEMLSMDRLLQLRVEQAMGFDIVFSIGTTSVFPYIAQPVLHANKNGKPTVEINPGESDISTVVDTRLQTGARVALEAIWQAYLAKVAS